MAQTREAIEIAGSSNIGDMPQFTPRPLQIPSQRNFSRFYGSAPAFESINKTTLWHFAAWARLAPRVAYLQIRHEA
jgi:hypothetical protein